MNIYRCVHKLEFSFWSPILNALSITTKRTKNFRVLTSNMLQEERSIRQTPIWVTVIKWLKYPPHINSSYSGKQFLTTHLKEYCIVIQVNSYAEQFFLIFAIAFINVFSFWALFFFNEWWKARFSLHHLSNLQNFLLKKEARRGSAATRKPLQHFKKGFHS